MSGMTSFLRCSSRFMAVLRSSVCASVRSRRCSRGDDLAGTSPGRLRAMTAPRSKISPPQTPQGSARSRAPARQASRTGQSAQRLLACSSWAGSRRTTAPGPRPGTAGDAGPVPGAHGLVVASVRGAAGPGEPGSAVGRRAVDRLLHCRSSSYSSSATAGGGPPTGGRGRGAAEKQKGRGSRVSGSAASEEDR